MTQPILRSLDAVSITIGIVVGVGIYESLPIIAASLGDPKLVLIIVLLGGILSLCGVLSYVELVSRFQDSGGEYHYLTRCYGPATGFLYVWARALLIQPGSIAAMAFPLAHYLQSLLLGVANYSGINSNFLSSSSFITLSAVSAIIIFTVINLRPLSQSASTQNLLSILKVSALGFLIMLGFFVHGPPPLTFETTEGNPRLALILVLFCFGGWSEIALITNLVKGGYRGIYRAMMISLGAVTLLYASLSWSFLSILGTEGVANTKAIAADAMKVFFPGIASTFVAGVIVISAAGAINAMMITGGELVAALGRTHTPLSILDKRLNGRPAVSIVLQGLASIAFVILAKSFTGVVVYTTSVVWVFYLLIGMTVFIFRWRFGPPPFQTPLYPLVPILFCASAIFLLYSSIEYDWIGSLIAGSLAILGYPVFIMLRQTQLPKGQ